MFSRFALLDPALYIPDKAAPGKAEWGDANFTTVKDAGVCRPPGSDEHEAWARAYPNDKFPEPPHIRSEESGLTRSEPRPSPGGKACACEECGAHCYNEQHAIVCGECGLVQEKTKDEDGELFYGSMRLNKELWKHVQYEPFDMRGNNPIPHFTHTDYIKTKFRRCLLDAHRYQSNCRRGWYFDLPGKCPHPEKKSCAQCDYAIQSSIKDREQGADYLPWFMRYPILAALTVQNVPWVWPDSAEAATDPDLAKLYKEMNRNLVTKRKLPISEKTIHKIRVQMGGNSLYHTWIKPYAHVLHRGTIVEVLLRDHKNTGARALTELHMFFESSLIHGFAPTRPNFIDNASGPDATSEERKQATNDYEALIKTQVIFGYTPFFDREKILYACEN